VAYKADDWTTYTDDASNPAKEGSYQYKLFYSPGKMRSEYEYALKNGQKVSTVAINRIDQKLTWTIQPDQKTYVTMKNHEKVPTAMLQTDGLINVYLFDRVEQAKAGEEDVNGVKAVKYKVAMTNVAGEKLEGFVWRTKDNITLKVNATVKRKVGNTERLARELKNLKISPQDASLFEVPAGFTEKVVGYVK
jgi:hypothetical protein